MPGPTTIGFLTALCCFMSMLTLPDAETLECEEDSVKIASPWVYDMSGTPCHQIVTEFPDTKHVVFREECQRWYGLANRPRSVDNYRVESCYTYPNGTTRYRADVCCSGLVKTQRCFQCANSRDDYECVYHNNPQTCQTGQVCQTTVTFHYPFPFTRRRKSNTCADRETCHSLMSLNSRMCQSWIPHPSCVYCCDTPFCNAETRNPLHYVAENKCSSNPCSNGGLCILDELRLIGYRCHCPANFMGTWCEVNLLSTFSAAVRFPCDNRPCKNQAMCVNQGRRFFRCMCKQGFTGIDCSIERPLCNPEDSTFCLNGGTCWDHGIYGTRCQCPDGFVGSQCELPVLTCRYLTSTWRSAYKMFVDFRGTRCTERVVNEDSAPLDDAFKLRQCKDRLAPADGRRFRDNVDGEVSGLEARSLWTCAQGDRFGEYSDVVCCPSCYSMPCLNGGWCTQTDDGDYLCKCRSGWEGRNCEIKPARCVVTGDPHFRAFDGTVLTSQGTCTYEMSSTVYEDREDSFGVFLSNSLAQGNDASYPAQVYFNMGGHQVRILRSAKVMVDEVEVELEYRDDLFRIYYNGRFVRIDTPYEVSVEFHSLQTFILKVGPSYAGLLRGICGNYDGDPMNPELYTKHGVWQPKLRLIVKSWQVALKRVLPKCNPVRLKRDANQGDDPEFSPVCNRATSAIIASRSHCGLIKDRRGVFRECILDPASAAADEYNNCFFDACAYQREPASMKKAACDSLAYFAFTCQSLGYPVNWRSHARCVPECPQGLVYKALTSACHATCRNPNAVRECTLPDTENCVCPTGLVLHNDTCVEPDECGCIGAHGHRYEIGDHWTSEDCTLTYRCVLCLGCAYKVGVLQKSHTRCKPYQECRYDPDTRLGECVLDVTCPESMHFDPLASACPATCQDPDAPRQCTQGTSPRCVCPQGFVHDNGTCLDPSECDCLDHTDRAMQIGSTWLSANCSVEFKCVQCSNCSLSVAVVQQTPHSCDPDKLCVPLTETHGQCSKVPSCPLGMTYTSDPSDPCLSSCGDPEDLDCVRDVHDGCVCESGLVYNGTQCVEPSACGCLDEHGTWFETETSWLSDDCGRLYSCQICDTCVSEVPVITTSNYSCPPDHICVITEENNTGSCQSADCPEGMTMVANAYGCPPTCADPEGLSTCSGGVLDLCRCPEGLVDKDGMCVTPSQCHCHTAYGDVLEMGTSWLSRACDTLYACEPCGSCSLPVGLLTVTSWQCPDGHKCIPDGPEQGLCVPDCPDGMLFADHVSGCPSTCNDPEAPKSCGEPSRPGCRCPEGFVLDRNNQCVRPDTCPCTDTDGREKPRGSWWLSVDCTTRFSCEECTDCDLPVALIRRQGHSCEEGEVCHQTDVNTGHCLLPTG